jgi:hypothetical protein
LSARDGIAFGAVLAIVFTSGCEAPPPPREASGPTRVTHAMREEPLRASACIARNIDRYRTPYSARIRPGTAPAIAEVIVTGREIVSIVQLYESGDASTAVIVTQPVDRRDELVAAMIEGC